MLAVVSGPLTLMDDWEQVSDDVVFLSNFLETSWSWLLPLKSIKQLFKVNGDAVWKVWACYQHTRKNMLLRFAWAVSHHSTAHAQFHSRYHPIEALSRASSGDVLH